MEFSYLTPTYQGLYTITAKSNTITEETLFGPPPPTPTCVTHREFHFCFYIFPLPNCHEKYWLWFDVHSIVCLRADYRSPDFKDINHSRHTFLLPGPNQPKTEKTFTTRCYLICIYQLLCDKTGGSKAWLSARTHAREKRLSNCSSSRHMHTWST